MAAAAALVSPLDAAVKAVPTTPVSSQQEQLRTIYGKLTDYLRELIGSAKVRLKNGVVLLLPSGDSSYRSVWPDDSLYPLIADPRLVIQAELSGQLQFLTESVVEMTQLPDRVDSDGLPILSPGHSTQPPMTDRMALHLPAAWVRLLSYYRSFDIKIPRKREWAGVVERSFNLDSFACGLAYADPQKPPIGYGYQDSIRITGFDLMTSIVLYRGLQRASALFSDVADPATLERWKELAAAIPPNLHRLYDPAIGGYVGGSRQGHQFSVWGNGLAYFLAPAPVQQQIVQFYRNNRKKIFLLGCTRQIAEPGGWQGPGQPPVGYQNGGFWSTGTGYVLPAIYDQDPTFALELADELVRNLPKIDYCEWLDGTGKPVEAMKFLPGVAVPCIGIKSILERRPLIEYF